MVGVFTKIGLSEARAHFDGSCDSGMVDDIRLPEDFTTDIEEIEVIADDQVISLYDFLEEFAYEILEDKVGGWEIDAGGFGDVIFRCDGSITLEFNGRIEDYYHDEYEIFDEMEDEE
jgi:hypothetical protein